MGLVGCGGWLLGGGGVEVVGFGFCGSAGSAVYEALVDSEDPGNYFGLAGYGYLDMLFDLVGFVVLGSSFDLAGYAVLGGYVDLAGYIVPGWYTAVVGVELVAHVDVSRRAYVLVPCGRLCP